LLPQTVFIETLYVETTYWDTVYSDSVKMIYTEKDTTAFYRFEPKQKYLVGFADIYYNTTKNQYKIESQLVVLAKVVTETIKVPVVIPHPLFRGSISMGYLKSPDGGVISLGAGLFIKDKIGIFATGLSNESVGIQLVYNF